MFVEMGFLLKGFKTVTEGIAGKEWVQSTVNEESTRILGCGGVLGCEI